jgi:UDP-N-acetylmuramoylalanine--D-glutamate ligase
LVKKVVFTASVLMNITPDHLERHGGMDGYIKAKHRIFERQRDKHACFVGLDDGYCRDIYIDLVREHRTNIVPFTVTQHQHMDRGIEVGEDGVLHDRYNDHEFRYDLSTIAKLKGRHNWQNIAAAYGVARYFGLSPDAIMETVHRFPGLPHRMEMVATISNVTFVNDSKATNADAASRALEPFEAIYWIIGGVAKSGGIEPLEPYFGKIKHAFLIGEAQEAFARTLEGKVSYTRCGDLENATHTAAKMAFRDANTPSMLLLSPACASFDQWKNFEARGDAFRQYVRDIAAKGI